jgi:hypothetical protein
MATEVPFRTLRKRLLDPLGSIEGYDAFDDPYAYPGTTVLRNLLDIRDQDTLEAFEVEITTL